MGDLGGIHAHERAGRTLQDYKSTSSLRFVPSLAASDLIKGFSIDVKIMYVRDKGVKLCKLIRTWYHRSTGNT